MSCHQLVLSFKISPVIAFTKHSESQMIHETSAEKLIKVDWHKKKKNTETSLSL